MPTKESLFVSPIVQVYIGKTSKLFNVHKDVLSRSPVLLSRICEGPDGPSITEPRISVLVFDLALQFLYGQPFDELKDKLSTTVEPSLTDANTLKPACELLCVALKYELVELEKVLASFFLDTRHVSYRSILAAAKYVFTKAPKVEPWFNDFIYQRTREAFVADPGLVDETWFMDIFEHGHSGLSRHLFECYKNWCRSPRRGNLTPTSERDTSVDFEKQNRPKQSSASIESPKESPVAWDHGLNARKEEERETNEALWYVG